MDIHGPVTGLISCNFEWNWREKYESNFEDTQNTDGHAESRIRMKVFVPKLVNVRMMIARRSFIRAQGSIR